MSKKLIVFDYDGTLVEAFTHDLLDGVAEWFANNRGLYHFAIVNNFGGVGLRLWMETDSWGAPADLPTEDETYQRVSDTLMKLGLYVRNRDIICYFSFLYQSRNGNWSPRPHGKEQAIEWQIESRKPNNGLLLQAMKDADVTPSETLVVGDNWHGEDAVMARKSGADFILASEFFSKGASNDD